MHTHMNGLTAVTVSLMVLVVLGTLRLFAAGHPDSQLSRAFMMVY